jgi:hypothetical protein
MKWKTRASTTLYGSAYFLSIRTRMNSEFGPEYSISASRMSAAEECSMGSFFFERTEAMMAASLSEHPV